MSRHPRKTAAEFAAELGQDPEYQARLAAQAAAAATRGAAAAADQRELVRELQLTGAGITSVYDFVAGLTPSIDAAAVLVRHLDQPHIPVVREGIIRSLSCSHLRVPALEALKRGFRQAPTDQERWLFANALAAMATAQELAADVPGIGAYAELFPKKPSR